MRNIVGPHIQVARKAKTPPWTQEELAAELQLHHWNLSREGVAKIEAGIRQVTDIEVKLLATVLGVSVESLIRDE